jgi:hypothetical protein
MQSNNMMMLQIFIFTGFMEIVGSVSRLVVKLWQVHEWYRMLHPYKMVQKSLQQLAIFVWSDNSGLWSSYGKLQDMPGQIRAFSLESIR